MATTADDEIERLNAETAKLRADARKLEAERDKLSIENQKLAQEAIKLATEHRWYPVVIMTAAVGATAAATAAIVSLFFM